MRIAFVGLPLAALLLRRDGHTIVWAGICRRAASGTRRLVRELGSERVEVLPNLAERSSHVAALKPDVVVSWYWTKNVPRSFREGARFGAVGVHPSLLPRHRGADPFFWAIASGDARSGVTAHVLDDGYDTGPLLAQCAIDVDPRWNAWTLAKRLDAPSIGLLRGVVSTFGLCCHPVTQEQSQATEAPSPSDEDLEIRWSWTADEIVRRVRAAAPWPGAFTEIGRATVVLTRARATRDVPRALAAGEAFVRHDGVAVVAAGEGGVELLAGRLEGEGGEVELDADALASLVGQVAAAGAQRP